jgi:hypothetical protein
MSSDEKIEELEGEIVDLRFDLKRSRDKELIYLDILSNIDLSIKELVNREKENERFNLGETIDYKEAVVNLQNALNEYKRVYKINF